MSNEYQNPIDALFDDENCDPIILFNEKGEEIAFEQIALIPLKDKVYAILKPVKPIEGLGEDEALVFSIEAIETEEGDEQEALMLVTDEKIIDDVFKIYDELVDSQNQE